MEIDLHVFQIAEYEITRVQLNRLGRQQKLNKKTGLTKRVRELSDWFSRVLHVYRTRGRK
jgi:hypothetical protein